MARGFGLSIEADGAQETIEALKGLDQDLRRVANGEMRKAAGDCAGQLVNALRASAAGSGVPVAPRVAQSIRVKSDRLPSVTIGGTKRVGRTGAPAAQLVWGSEHGPRGDVNHFAVEPSAGHWIRPAVTRFRNGQAIQVYRRALFALIRKWRLG